MLCLLYSARVIAAGAIYCAARHCELDPHFPEVVDAEGRNWWDSHDMRWEDIKGAVNYMAELYDQNASRQPGEQSIYVGHTYLSPSHVVSARIQSCKVLAFVAQAMLHSPTRPAVH